MTEPTPEAYEAAAVELASQVFGSKHGQLCPVWVRKARVAECDCWILGNARRDVHAAVDAVWPIAIAQARATVAAEIRGLPPVSMPAVMRRHPWWNNVSGPTAHGLLEWAARTAEGADHE